MNLDKLQNIILEYDLPFALDLKDCMKPDHKGEGFLVFLNDIPAQIRFKETILITLLEY